MAHNSFHDRIHNFPTFQKLPDLLGLPKGCTCGLWDQHCVRDELSTLNLLTPDTVKQAAEEIREELGISLRFSKTERFMPYPLI